MAHIILRRHAAKCAPECVPDCIARSIIINGVDMSLEIYADGVELVEVGDDPDSSEVGLRFTIGVGRLDLDGEETVALPDNISEVADRVRELVTFDKDVT